jgi:hypothetical protein
MIKLVTENQNIHILAAKNNIFQIKCVIYDTSSNPADKKRVIAKSIAHHQEINHKTD